MYDWWWGNIKETPATNTACSIHDYCSTSCLSARLSLSANILDFLQELSIKKVLKLLLTLLLVCVIDLNKHMTGKKKVIKIIIYLQSIFF